VGYCEFFSYCGFIGFFEFEFEFESVRVLQTSLIANSTMSFAQTEVVFFMSIGWAVTSLLSPLQFSKTHGTNELGPLMNIPAYVWSRVSGSLQVFLKFPGSFEARHSLTIFLYIVSLHRKSTTFLVTLFEVVLLLAPGISISVSGVSMSHFWKAHETNSSGSSHLCFTFSLPRHLWTLSPSSRLFRLLVHP